MTTPQTPPAPASSVTRFFAHSPFFPAPWVLGIPLVALAELLRMIPLVGFVLAALPTALAYAAVATLPLCFVPSRVVVGEDGVEVRWLFWRRFTPIGDVRALQRTLAIPARLLLRNGRTAFLPYTFSPRSDLLGERSKALLAIDAALERASKRIASEETPTGLLQSRRDETAAAWKQRLEAERASYRAEAVPDEVLWRVVTDPSADDAARAAATVMIAQTANAEERARIGAIAATTVSSKLRVVLERAAQQAPEEAMIEGLGGVAEDARARGVRG